MVAIAQKIQEIIDAPKREISLKEAQSILRYCGIIDKKNNVTPKFQDIVIPKEDENK